MSDAPDLTQRLALDDIIAQIGVDKPCEVHDCPQWTCAFCLWEVMIPLRAAIAEANTLAGIGTWRPNRRMAARELAKSQAVINKLADRITELEAALAEAQLRLNTEQQHRVEVGTVTRLEQALAEAKITASLVQRADAETREAMTRLTRYAVERCDPIAWVGKSSVDWAIAEIDRLRSDLADAQARARQVPDGEAAHEGWYASQRVADAQADDMRYACRAHRQRITELEKALAEAQAGRCKEQMMGNGLKRAVTAAKETQRKASQGVDATQRRVGDWGQRALAAEARADALQAEVVALNNDKEWLKKGLALHEARADAAERDYTECARSRIGDAEIIGRLMGEKDAAERALREAQAVRGAALELADLLATPTWMCSECRIQWQAAQPSGWQRRMVKLVRDIAETKGSHQQHQQCAEKLMAVLASPPVAETEGKS